MRYETYRELMDQQKGFAITTGLDPEYGIKYKEEKQQTQSEDNDITTPKHYNSTGIEVINVIETYATQYPSLIIPHIANVLKYTCRAPYKGAMLNDLKKARAYLTRAITTLEGNPRWE